MQSKVKLYTILILILFVLAAAVLISASMLLPGYDRNINNMAVQFKATAETENDSQMAAIYSDMIRTPEQLAEMTRSEITAIFFGIMILCLPALAVLTMLRWRNQSAYSAMQRHKKLMLAIDRSTGQLRRDDLRQN